MEITTVSVVLYVIKSHVASQEDLHTSTYLLTKLTTCVID